MRSDRALHPLEPDRSHGRDRIPGCSGRDRIPGLLGPPDELARRVALFWGDRNGRARSLWGTVRLRPATLDHPVVQSWRGHVRLRTSLVPIPVDLEVERWRSIGLMITLRPTHTHGRIGAHRRWAWFSTGHGVLEQVRVAVERGERPG